MFWPTKKVLDCIERISKKSGVPSKQYQRAGKFPVVDQGQDFIGGYTDNSVLIYKDDIPVIVFGDHTRAIKFIDFPFAVGADGTKVLKPKNFLDAKYFYYALTSLNIESRGYARHFSILKEMEIPVPTIVEQKKIVARLDALSEKIKKLQEYQNQTQTDLIALEKSILYQAFNN